MIEVLPRALTERGNLKIALQEYSDTKTFSAYATNVAIGNNKSMLSIENAVGGSTVVRVIAIKVINTQATAITGVVADFRLLKCTGHSSGTLVVPESSDSVDALSSDVTVRTGATISGEGTGLLVRAQWSSDEWGVGSEDVESADHRAQFLTPFYAPLAGTKPITLRGGEGLTIKQVTNSTSGMFDVAILFTVFP
jgi:hypothetical protein